MCRVSVAMATYNGEQFIKEQLDSILAQTVAIDELIICDDGSTDHTVDILLDYQKKYSCIHLYENEKNLGYKLNFKKALDIATGDYIFLCDQDDVWMLDKVEKMIHRMQENPKIQVLASSFDYIDENGAIKDVPLLRGRSNNNLYTKQVEKGQMVEVKFEEFYNHNFFQGCSLALTKEFKDILVQHYSTIVAHDYLINFTAAKMNGMYFWDVPLFQYRIHEKNTIGIIDEGGGLIKRFRRGNTLFIRSITTKDGISMLNALKETDPAFYEKRKDYFDHKIQFYKSHLHNLEQRKFFRLLFENFNPYYREYANFLARIRDLLYALLG